MVECFFTVGYCFDFGQEKWSGILVCFILIQQIKGKEGEKPIFIPSGIESSLEIRGFCGHTDLEFQMKEFQTMFKFISG